MFQNKQACTDLTKEHLGNVFLNVFRWGPLPQDVDYMRLWLSNSTWWDKLIVGSDLFKDQIIPQCPTRKQPYWQFSHYNVFSKFLFMDIGFSQKVCV